MPKTRLSAEAVKDILEARKEHGDRPGVGELIDRLALRYRVNKSTIQYHIQKDRLGHAPRYPLAAISKAPEAPEAHGTPDYEVDALPPQAPDMDGLADMILLQSNIVAWARVNESDRNRLQALAVQVSSIIEALEASRRLSGLEVQNQDLQARLNGAESQVQRLQDIIDKEREERRREENQQTHGE